jgi:hypothetical protein
MEPGIEFMENILSTLHKFIDGSADLINKYKSEPAKGSIFIQERDTFPNQELVNDVFWRGALSMESAADHLMVYIDSITEPAETIAPMTCIRGLLESCAIALFFLDPQIDVKERVARCFAFRYLGYIEQEKFMKSGKLDSQIINVRKRIEKVEQDATSLGYPRILDKKGKINGIAKHMPSIVDLIDRTLGYESEYRLLSAIAHGHHWAIMELGFQKENIDIRNGPNSLVKHLHPVVVEFCSKIAVSAYSKVLWSFWRVYGYDMDEIELFLDQVYQSLGYVKSFRFWPHP